MPKFTQGKWHADDMCQYIFSKDEQMMIAQIRGWGRLTGKGAGGMGLSDEEAYEIQKANARLIASATEMYRWVLEVLGNERIHKSTERAIEKLLARIDGEENKSV